LWFSSAPSYQYGQYLHGAQHFHHTLHNTSFTSQPIIPYYVIKTHNTAKLKDTKHISTHLNFHFTNVLQYFIITNYTYVKQTRPSNASGRCLFYILAMAQTILTRLCNFITHTRKMECLKILEPQPPGTLRACQGL
jgi:hypothetical protein